MRVYAEVDLPDLRDQMVEAGFRFKDEKGLIAKGSILRRAPPRVTLSGQSVTEGPLVKDVPSTRGITV